ncbi:MAG: NAD(P)H-binding protein [Actinomycetota bacterium]|nr:NAD(P)H-binding protein [Actinomycetota bacterium]
MKVVVAGGTGFLGRHICKALLRGGHDVTVLGRNPDKVASIPELQGANATRGDVTDPASLVGRFEGADAVVQAVQFPNHPIEVPRRGLTYDRYDRQGTENVLNQARRSGVQRLVYISGAGADAVSEKPWYRAKGLAEQVIFASGIDYAIVRPSWAYGPEDRALNRFVQIARLSPVVPQPGATPQRIQPIYVGDVALVVARIFEREAWNEIYEIGSREVMTMNEVVRTLLDVMGKKRPVVPIPTGLLKVATAPLKVLPAPPMTPQGIEFATQEGLVDISKAVQLLGFEPLSFRDGLALYMKR